MKYMALERPVELTPPRQQEFTTLTVILPVYNGMPFLVETLESILAQTYTDFELWIIDDHSTDDSMPVVEHYRQTDPRIRVFRHPKKLGPALVLNAIIPLIQSKYTCIMHADDLWAPDKLATQIAFMQAHPEYGITGFDHFYIDPNSNTFYEQCLERKPWLLQLYNLIGPRFCLSNICCESSLLKQVGGFGCQYNYKAEDYLFFIKHNLLTQPASIGPSLASYRVHTSSTSQQNLTEINQVCATLCQQFINQVFGLTVHRASCTFIRIPIYQATYRQYKQTHLFRVRETLLMLHALHPLCKALVPKTADEQLAFELFWETLIGNVFWGLHPCQKAWVFCTSITYIPVGFYLARQRWLNHQLSHYWLTVKHAIATSLIRLGLPDFRRAHH